MSKPKVLRRAYEHAPFIDRWNDDRLAWDEKLGRSDTWLHEGQEVLVLSRFGPLKHAGLMAGAQRARPELQRRGQRESRATYVIAAWKVGLYLAFRRFAREGAPGPWWTGGNSWVMSKLASIEPGPKRVRAVAAVVAALALLDRNHLDPCEAIRPLIRRAGVHFDEDLAGG